MTNPFSLLKYAGLGAGIMYFFDPIVGKGRRTRVRDQFIHACTVSNKKAGVVYRDASNRLQGAKAELRSVIEPSDEGVVQRIQEGAVEIGKTLGMRGNTWSPTAKALAALAGVGCIAALLNKRDLGALALGGLGLAMSASSVCQSEMNRQSMPGRSPRDTDDNMPLDVANAPREVNIPVNQG